jgi:predicted flap endonuclease-1-like 5' DNA nuclease
MSLIEAFPSVAGVEQRAEQALRWPVGVVSPLWAVFGAAASAGVAWWWMTRWTRAVNVEALANLAAAQTTQSALAVADVELRVEEAVAVAEVVADAPEPAAPALAPVLEAEATPAMIEPLEPDDLTRMTGIGPKLSAALAERGVTRFAQIAAWTADELAELDAALSLKGRAVREAWVAQAKRLAGS